jgi:SAM-dependent methyltransferase
MPEDKRLKKRSVMFDELEKINTRPRPFEFYTADDLWTDDHTARRMLSLHLNGAVDAASRKAAFIDSSVDWIVSRFSVKDGTRIADFGCGPGLYAARLAQKKADVTGIDFSPGSIRYAREAADRAELSIRYLCLNYLEYETEDRYDLILMIMCDFCALSGSQRQTMLRKFHTLLAPGGSVLFDVYSLAAFAQWEETARYEAGMLDGFWSPRKYYGFLNTFKYEEEKVVLDQYTIIEAERGRTVYNWFQCFRPELLEAELAACGLTTDALYADVAGGPFDPEGTEFAVVARKR